MTGTATGQIAGELLLPRGQGSPLVPLVPPCWPGTCRAIILVGNESQRGSTRNSLSRRACRQVLPRLKRRLQKSSNLTSRCGDASSGGTYCG